MTAQLAAVLAATDALVIGLVVLGVLVFLVLLKMLLGR